MWVVYWIDVHNNYNGEFHFSYWYFEISVKKILNTGIYTRTILCFVLFSTNDSSVINVFIEWLRKTNSHMQNQLSAFNSNDAKC